MDPDLPRLLHDEESTRAISGMPDCHCCTGYIRNQVKSKVTGYIGMDLYRACPQQAEAK